MSTIIKHTDAWKDAGGTSTTMPATRINAPEGLPPPPAPATPATPSTSPALPAPARIDVGLGGK